MWVPCWLERAFVANVSMEKGCKKRERRQDVCNLRNFSLTNWHFYYTTWHQLDYEYEQNSVVFILMRVRNSAHVFFWFAVLSDGSKLPATCEGSKQCNNNRLRQMLSPWLLSPLGGTSNGWWIRQRYVSTAGNGKNMFFFCSKNIACMKLTAKAHPLKMDGWKMKCPFGMAYF